VAGGLLGFVIVGYVVGLPLVLWCLADLKSFHRPEWVGYGNRRAWQIGVVSMYLLGGWPGIFTVIGWRASKARAGLAEQRERFADVGLADR
jgi:hypothetical protein